MSMLERVLDLLFPPRASARRARGADIAQLAALLSPRSVPLSAGSAVALFPYKGLVKALIVEAKFYQDERAAALLGDALADYFLEELADANAYERRTVFLVPVPLHERRRRERGHNQAERICRHALSRLEGLATLDAGILARVRETLPQTALGRAERRANMRDAFRAAQPLDPDALYILADDVVTTGATLDAALAALRAGGAERVRAVALAA
jgi:ComF family protein